MRGDPIEALRYAVNAVDRCDELVRLVDTIRRIDESSVSTLKRILRERQEIVELLRGSHIPFADFDFEYKGNLVDAVKRFLQKSVAASAKDAP